MIIAVLAAKCPAPNWIVSPELATSTASSSVAHAVPPGMHVGSLPAVVTVTVAARVAAGNATSSASAASSPNRERRQPRYGTNAANNERTTTTSTLGESVRPERPAGNRADSTSHRMSAQRLALHCTQLRITGSGVKAVSRLAPEGGGTRTSPRVSTLGRRETDVRAPSRVWSDWSEYGRVDVVSTSGRLGHGGGFACERRACSIDCNQRRAARGDPLRGPRSRVRTAQRCAGTSPVTLTSSLWTPIAREW